MPRHARLSVVLVALALIAAGAWLAVEVRRLTTDAGEYQIKFLDDAEANATPPAGQMPLTFPDHTGGTVDLAGYRGKKHVVLVFVRGVPQGNDGRFCPFCLAQTSSLMASLDEFRRRNAEVLMVFPGPADQVRVLVAQAAGDPAATAPFPLLLDLDLKACEALGIRGDLAKPSTYVIDKTGNVVYAYVGKYTADRPSVKAILKQLDRLPRGD